jgi:hypothetical protein
VEPCTCGQPHPHRVLKRRTADDRLIYVWSDGTWTTIDNVFIPGLGRPRSKFRRSCLRKAGLALADDIPLYDFAELRTLLACAQEEFKHRYTSEDTRKATIRIRCKQRLSA